jgi:hypothetical protein
MRRALLILSVFTLVVASCGDDDAALFTTTTAPADTVTTSGAPPTTVGPTSTTLAGTPTTATMAPTTTAIPTTTTTVPVTTHPGLPAALSRSVIPMDQIDQGWVAAAYSADTINPYTEGPTVLYLVSPAGDRYELASFEAGGPQADYVGNISNDGTHVAVAVYVPGGPSKVVSIDIATGQYDPAHRA